MLSNENSLPLHLQKGEDHENNVLWDTGLDSRA